MPAAIFDVGDFAIAGWATEATPGTPVAAANYVAGQIGSLNLDFNPDLQDVDIMSGKINQTVAIVPRKGRGQWSLATDLFPTLNYTFLSQNGVGATAIAPTSFTLSASMKAGAYQYPGCRSTQMRIRGDAATGAMVQYTGLFTGRPVPIAALAAPSLTGEDPYTWENFKQVTLVSGATSVSDVESIDLTIDTPHAMGYGQSGVALPNILVCTGVHIKGTIQLYMNDTNIAEYNAAIAAGGTAGSLVFSWDKGPAVGTKLTSFTLANVKYTTPKIQYPKGGVDLITLGFSSFSPTLANQLVVAQTTH